MQRIKPPPSLKSIGFDVPNASLPQAVLSWLVAPRDNYAPECIVVTAQNNSDMANNALVRVLDHAHTYHYMSTFILRYQPEVLPILNRHWLTFLHPYHSDWFGPGSTKESICDNVSLGRLPNLERATFCVLFSTGDGEIDDLFKSGEHLLAITYYSP